MQEKRHRQLPPHYNQPPSHYNQPPSHYNQPPSHYNQPPSHYNQPPTVTKVVQAVVTQTAPMGIPQYNPNHFFPMQQPTNLHSPNHAPHVHVHNSGHIHGHK